MPRTEITPLANGARLVDLTRDTGGWVALGLWWRAGSRYEGAGEQGWAHLLEHLWFRGGRDHDAAAVDRVADRLGGQLNAETGRELIGLWGLAPADAAGDLAALLTDMLLTPAFDGPALAAERGLVLTEMAALDHAPLNRLVDAALAALWPDHPLGRPIEGRRDSVAAARVEDLRAWHGRHLTGERLIATVMGPWPPAVRERLARAVTELPTGPGPSVTPPRVAPPDRLPPVPAGPATLLWAVPLPGLGDLAHGNARLAVQALGGGLSALLPSTLRRERGLVYDISATLEPALDASAALIHADAPDAPRTAAVVESLLDDVARSGLPTGAAATAAAALRAGETLATTRPVDAMRAAALETLAANAAAVPERVGADIVRAFGPSHRWRFCVSGG